MRRRGASVPFLFLLALLSPLPGRAEVTRAVGSTVVRVDDTLAYPGGLFVVDLSARRGVRGSVVAVLDGHPHTLSFLDGVHRRPCAYLGVDDFGQSGDLPDLYRHFGIDADTIVGAAYDVMQE